MPHTWSNEGLSAQPLRYVICLLLQQRQKEQAHAQQHAPMTVGEIIAAVEATGLPIAGRASKTVSDALRTEVRRGRVRPCGRGRYALDRVPESTARYMRNWLAANRARLAAAYAASTQERT